MRRRCHPRWKPIHHAAGRRSPPAIDCGTARRRFGVQRRCCRAVAAARQSLAPGSCVDLYRVIVRVKFALNVLPISISGRWHDESVHSAESSIERDRAPSLLRPETCRLQSQLHQHRADQYRCSCAILSPSNADYQHRFSPASGQDMRQHQSIGMVWVNRKTISSTSLPWPMVRDTGTISVSGGIWGRKYLA